MTDFIQTFASGVPQNLFLLYLALFFATFLHEGAAIALGAVFLAQQQSSPIPTFMSLAGGIITGDVAVFGLGRLASRYAWAQRLFGSKPKSPPLQWSTHHLLATIALCRVVPGLLFPTFFTCGWQQMPFRRIALTTSIVSSVYVMALLTVFVQFGRQVSWSPQLRGYVVVGAIMFGIAAVIARALWARYRARSKRTIVRPPGVGGDSRLPADRQAGTT